MQRNSSLFATPRAGILLVALAAVARAAGQDQSFFFQVTNPVSLEQPVTEVEVWASFDPAYYSFALAHFAIESPADDGTFFDPRFPKPFLGDEGYIPPGGDSVAGIRAQQFQWIGVDSDTANPIKIWSCSWTTEDFTPRQLDLSLLATQFWVYLDPSGQGLQVEFVPDALGFINIVPAPATGAVAMLASTIALRRRR